MSKSARIRALYAEGKSTWDIACIVFDTESPTESNRAYVRIVTKQRKAPTQTRTLQSRQAGHSSNSYPNTDRRREYQRLYQRAWRKRRAEADPAWYAASLKTARERYQPRQRDGSTIILTIRQRLKDKHAAELNRQAAAVNYVWNYCNEMQQKAVHYKRIWLDRRKLCKLTKGSSRELDLHSHTIHQVCIQYDQSRSLRNRPWLQFRGKKSLGWIPFSTGIVKHDGTTFMFRGHHYDTMNMRSLSEGAVVRGGSFSQDARGRWYINCPVEVPVTNASTDQDAVGIDLGIKNLAVLSTGYKVANPQHFACMEKHISKAQRAHKKRLVKTLAAKVANRRKDHLHKTSRQITLAHSLVFVGDVSGTKLASTLLAKAAYDAGWSTFRKMLSYKALRHGGRMIEVDERMTSQTCSSCGSQDAPERPEGIAGLRIRKWTCGGCGATHDRDVNAARNILRLGLETLVAGAA